MAANQGNLVNAQVPIGTLPAQPAAVHPPSLAVQRAAALQAKLDATERRLTERAATSTLCDDIISSACAQDGLLPGALTTFYLFPKLPAELRVKIFQCSIDASRFFELSRVNCSRQFANHYDNVCPPSLLLACKESNEEVMKAYKSYHELASEDAPIRQPYTRWTRFDHDVFHMKPSSSFATLLERMSIAYRKPDHILPIRQHNRLNSQVNLSTDKWIGRPAHFEKIKALAVSRDLLSHMPDDCEPFIRHFFPNLSMLLVLIDEETDIDHDWGIHDLEYARYDKPMPNKLLSISNPLKIPRLDFIAKCKAPFKEVTLNIDYRMDIEFEMRKRFEKEEETYNFYTAPRVRVLGSYVPGSIKVDDCGRLPVEAVEPRKNKYNSSPFGNFANEDDSIISR